MIRVVLVDDQQLIRMGLIGILSAEPGIEVIGEAGDGREGLRLVRQLRPDLVLMDLRMPVSDGVEATAAIRADVDLAATRILVLTTFEQDEHVIAALRAGADGFLGKGADPRELVHAVRDVVAGDVSLSPSALRAVVGHVSSTPSTPPADPAALDLVSALTERERDVVAAVGDGMSNDQIAADMFISPYTVKTHLNRAMTKLNARDRAAVVVIARRAQLVYDPHDA